MPESPIEIVVAQSPAIVAEIESAIPINAVAQEAPIQVLVESPNQADVLLEIFPPPEILVQVPPPQPINVQIETPPEILVQIMEGGGESGASPWLNLANSWTQPPSKIADMLSGSVYQYLYGITSYFRLVPDPYDSTLDSFYSTFSAPTLSGLLATRGNII